MVVQKQLLPKILKLKPYIPSIIYLYFVVTGHLITVDSTFLYNQEKAVLVSPVLDQQEWGCVRLVYQITGRGSLHLHLRPDSDNFDYQLWAANKASDSWLIASVDLPNTTIPYQVGMNVFNELFNLT